MSGIFLLAAIFCFVWPIRDTLVNVVNVLCSLLLHELGTWKRHQPIKAI